MFATCSQILALLLILPYELNGQKLSREELQELSKICGYNGWPYVPSFFKSAGQDNQLKMACARGGKACKKAKLGAFPSAVFVRTNGVEDGKCGGVLISKRHVLTAAHCLFNLNKTDCYYNFVQYDLVRDRSAGVWVGHPDRGHPGGLWMRVVRQWYHPEFVSSRCAHSDIGILELNGTIPDRLLEYLNFPSDTQYPPKGKLGYYPKHMRFEQLEYLDKYTCRNNQKYMRRGELYSDQICTNEDINNVCMGDSGGGLLQQSADRTESSRQFVVGLVSRGANCSHYDPTRFIKMPGAVYTDVRAQLGVICEQTGVCV